MTENKKDLPILIYDNECSFCKIWISYWKQLLRDKVSFKPYQDCYLDYQGISEKEFKRSVHFIDTDSQVYRGAGGIYKLLSYIDYWKWLYWTYKNIPIFLIISEFLYTFVSKYRSAFFKLTKLLWGNNIGPNSYILSRWLFIRSIAVVYLIAFSSFLFQSKGLIGSNGISPAEIYLSALKLTYGDKAYLFFPTLAWLDKSDLFLQILPIAGIILAFLLILGFLNLPILIALWMIYLSLLTVGQSFMSFQWDILLLESGFLAILLSPVSLFSLPYKDKPPNFVIVFLTRFLLFRVMFSSGIGKLVSGDPTWRDFTALNYHYYTQPLPTPIAWYAHQLPEWLHKISVQSMFIIEIFVPFFYFAPRIPRFIAGFLTIMFQIGIMLTGNYTYFNILTIILCIPLFDDNFFLGIITKNLELVKKFKTHITQETKISVLRRNVIIVFATVILFLGSIQVAGTVYGYRNLPEFLISPYRFFSRFRIVNGYGLFTVMTTTRPEIIIEGSSDGKTWKEYTFKYKPDSTDKSLPIVAPHQPRLDWQMWFAALGHYRANQWFINMMYRLLEGSPDVIDLFRNNPFPDSPPRFIRAKLYKYEFTDLEERKSDNKIWKREYIDLYMPILKNNNI